MRVGGDNRRIIERDAVLPRAIKQRICLRGQQHSRTRYPPVSRNLFGRLREIALRQEFPEFAARVNTITYASWCTRLLWRAYPDAYPRVPFIKRGERTPFPREKEGEEHSSFRRRRDRRQAAERNKRSLSPGQPYFGGDCVVVSASQRPSGTDSLSAPAGARAGRLSLFLQCRQLLAAAPFCLPYGLL